MPTGPGGPSRIQALRQEAQTLKLLGLPYVEVAEAIRRDTGGQKLPEGATFVFGVFRELARTRGSNGYAPLAITFQEIMAWCVLSGTRLYPWEVDLIRALDSTWLEAWHAGPGARTP